MGYKFNSCLPHRIFRADQLPTDSEQCRVKTTHEAVLPETGMHAHEKGKSLLLVLHSLEVILGFTHVIVNSVPVQTQGPTIFHFLTTPISEPVLGPAPHGAITIIPATPLVVVWTGNYSRDEHDVVLVFVVMLDLYIGGM